MTKQYYPSKVKGDFCGVDFSSSKDQTVFDGWAWISKHLLERQFPTYSGNPIKLVDAVFPVELFDSDGVRHVIDMTIIEVGEIDKNGDARVRLRKYV